MSIIPTTFSESLPSYTVVGGARQSVQAGLSAVLLNRGGRYQRRSVFQELEKAGFDRIVSIEGTRSPYDIEEMAQTFPSVRFVLLHEAVTPGEAVNLASMELASPLFLVLWNDVRILLGGGAAKIAERVLGGAEGNSSGGDAPRLCTVPLIQNSRFETLPTLNAPAINKKKIAAIPFAPLREDQHTLYPFDGIGIYNRERFLTMGGFDEAIGKAYWQYLDFGFRARLWGEEIAATQFVKLAYEGPVPAEETTETASYLRFYLKNIAPVFRGDCAHIPICRFPGFARRARKGFVDAWEDFSAARQWVKTMRYRFRCDARQIAESWKLESAEGDVS